MERRLQLVEVSEDAGSAFSLCETMALYLYFICESYSSRTARVNVGGACSISLGSVGCTIIISRWGTNTAVREKVNEYNVVTEHSLFALCFNYFSRTAVFVPIY